MRIGVLALIFMVSFSLSCSGTTEDSEPVPEDKTVAWSQSAIDALAIGPGSIVVIKDGVYADAPIKIEAIGTVAKPILIRAETPGKVVVTGNSSLSISGAHIIVAGIHFRDCDVGAGDAIFNFRTTTKSHAKKSRLYNCVFSGSGQEINAEKDIKWVSVYGTENEIDHCSFIDKKVLGSLLVVWVDPSEHSLHKIHHNYFTHPISMTNNGSAINGQEMIRIGTSAVSMSVAQCEVWDNYFYRCNGEVEIISNKSCGNMYQNNLFRECEGTLTLRHGNGCRVDGNYFFGAGVKYTGGVRIIGEDHIVSNNYFEGLRGDNQRGAISLIRGVENSELYEYFQVKRARVVFNTIVNCYNGIVTNVGNATSTMPVIESVVGANLIMSNSGANDKGVVHTVSPTPDISWRDNYIFGASINGISPQDGGLTEMSSFELVTKDGIYVLDKKHLSKYSKIGDMGYITTDIRGAVRETLKTPGASDFVGTPTRTMPTTESAGAEWWTQ